MNATPPNPNDRVPLAPHLANDPWVVSFYQRLDRFAGDPARVADYERTLLELSDRVTELNKAHREGREEGREEERYQVLTRALRALLSAGTSPDEAAVLLALTPDERARLLPGG